MQGGYREIGIETMKATIGLISFFFRTRLTDAPPKYHPEEFLITTAASEGVNKVIDSTIGEDD